MVSQINIKLLKNEQNDNENFSLVWSWNTVFIKRPHWRSIYFIGKPLLQILDYFIKLKWYISTSKIFTNIQIFLNCNQIITISQNLVKTKTSVIQTFPCSLYYVHIFHSKTWDNHWKQKFNNKQVNLDLSNSIGLNFLTHIWEAWKQKKDRTFILMQAHYLFYLDYCNSETISVLQPMC